MKEVPMVKHSLVLVSALFVFACADEAPIDVDQPEATEAVTDGAATLAASGGDYRFALAESAVLPDLEKKCAASKQPSACMDEIRAEAAGEGLEITPISGNRVRFVSYATEAGKRVVLIDGEVTLKALGDGIVQMIPERIDVGKAPPADVQLLLEVIDADTIAMDKAPGGHPRTGGKRLVFHRETR
jgi:hypothetical protein